MVDKFCINCKHIGKNGSGDALKYKCFAVQNIQSKRLDLVTGQLNTDFKHQNCYTCRLDYADSCGPQGRWFEAAPPLPVTNVSPKLKPGLATDLLSQLDSFK